jgi:hypothetical protein
MGFVVSGTQEAVQDATGATVNFDVRRVRTTDELEQSLEINVDASYGCGAFGAGISARFDFAKKCQVQAESLFLAVTCSVNLEHMSIKDPRLTPDAVTIVSDTNLFTARYGNMFVRGIGRGGLFVGVFRLDVNGEQDRKDISAKLEGSYGLFSASAQAAWKEVRSTYRSDALVSMHYEGGPVDLHIDDPTDPTQLLQNANTWLASFKTDPAGSRPYSVTLAPITIAVGAPRPPDPAQLEYAQDVIVLCAKQRSMILDHINLLQFVSDHPDTYDWSKTATTRQEIADALANFQLDLDMVAHCASNAIRHTDQAKDLVKFAADEGATYPKGQMPQLPPAKEGVHMVNAPDLRQCSSWPECQAKATMAGLIAASAVAVGAPPSGVFSVVSQQPDQNTPMPSGTTVTVFTAPQPPRSPDEGTQTDLHLYINKGPISAIGILSGHHPG